MKLARIIVVVVLTGCGTRAPDVGEPSPPDATTTTEPSPTDPPPEILRETEGLDASCEDDDECIVTYFGGGCGCCNCTEVMVTSKSSHDWLMDELAKEQCDDSWCATIDCAACEGPPPLGTPICFEGECAMLVPEGVSLEDYALL